MSDEGEDSPPPRPRRKIKKIVLASSSSGSETDDSGPATSTRKKRPRVLSDEDSESGGSSVLVGRRRKRALPCLRDSEGDSDTSGWATDHSDAAARSQTAVAGEGASRPLKTASGFASDSSEGNSDKCSICLMRFTDQQVGTPQTCEHIFCLDCITEWSRNVNTCPVDRMTFDSIVVRACAGGRVLRTQSVQVVERPPSVEMLLVEDPTSCEICGGTNSEETMLLCDGCDLGFHMECLTPPLTRIPANQWLCPGCSERLHVLHAEQVSDVELFSDASETEEAAPGQPRRRAGAGAGAGRAGAGRARRPPPAAASTSRGAASAPAPAQRRAARTRRAHKRRRTRTRTLIIEYELQEDGKTPVTKRVRRKLTRRKTRRRVPRTAARRTQVRRSVRAKLAAQRTERAGAGGACGAGPRALAGLVPPLSLFGTPGDLDYFSGDDDAQPGPAGAAVAARAAPAAPSAAIAAYRQARRKMVSIPSPAHAAAAPDLLSSILESQTLLHSRRSVVSLSGSGELQVRLRPERRPAASPPADRPAAAGRLQVGAGGAGGARQAPSYPGQARGGGGWGGGYHYPAQRAPPPAGGARPPYDNGYGPGPAGGRPRAAGDDVFRPYEERRPHYGPPAPAWRPPRPPRRRTPHDDPLDMRLAAGPRCAPLPAPPAFPLPPDDDDAGLVIDTDKYDPTEPTDDDEPPAPPAPPAPAPPPLAPPASLAAVESLLAGGAEAGAAHVPAAVLDSAVRQVLLEHRSLLEPAGAERRDSDEGSDGDCPNFSIYSAASVHIAAAALEPPAPAPAPPAPPAPPPALDPLQRKSAEYNEKVSKRCPITTNTRNPIKIKLNTPALIRRQVSLYDEEDAPADGEPPAEPADTAHPDPPEAVVAEPPEAGDPDPPEHAEPADDRLAEPADEKDDTCEPDVEHGSAREPSEHGDGGAEERQPDEDDTGRTPEPPERAAGSPRGSPAAPDAAEKMTESISETEDERSYTPCLDEQREPERADHGLGTELISEDEGDGLFSEAERPSREPSRESEPAREPALAPAPSRSPSRSPSPPADAPRKKKKKEGKAKERKVKGGKLAFKKAGKGKERKYRSRSRSRSRSPSAASGGARSERRAREKRADLERYDVRTLVSERRRRVKDAFGRDVSPRAEPEPAPRRRSASSEPRRARAEPTPPPPRRARARVSPSPRRLRGSPEPRRTRPSPSPSPPMVRRSASPRPARRRRRSSSRGRRADGKRRRSGSRARKRRRSGSAPAVKPKAKKKKRARSERPRSRSRKKSPKRKRARRRSASRAASPPAEAPRPASPRTPPAPPASVPIEQRRLRKRRDRSKHRRADAAGPCKEVFTSGDNILVSVSFAEAGGADEAERRERRRERRRRRREAQPAPPSKPVAIIDLARSPCRELTPSPERVIVLSDEEAPPAPAPPPAAPVAGAGPMTPPSTTPAPSAPPPPADEGAGGGGRGPLTPPEPPDSPDAYDPFEPTASPPAAAPPHASPPRPSMTLEAAQKTNMSADEVLDRRPLSPIEKVMALLQSTRDAPPDPPPEGGAGAGTAPEPEAAAPRVVLPEPAGAGAARQPAPKLFLAKPSPIKSDPIKPMQQATKISRLPLPAVARGAGAGGGAAGGGDSPYSPGSSDFGDLFEPPAPPHHAPDHFDALFDKPPPRRKRRHNNKKGKTQVDVKIADDSLKVLDELPSSAVEMQVKTKFLKKLNRQERVVEEVKLVLKPHYNKKHVSKDEYKHILRRAVPKICHNKTGEINPTKIQALVEAYVKKFRKKHKLGVS